jgi:CubicO group peptidase (beta-lactamase class C family)
MKRIIFSVCYSLLLTAGFSQSPALGESKIKSLDSLFRLTFPSTEPGAIILLAKDGKPFFRKAYGMANIELPVTMNTDHKMGIGSISKQFTAMALLLLQQEGKLNVKDDIRKYLPQYNTWGRTITIDQILSHTSGIPSYTELPGFDTLADKKISNSRLINFFEKSPLIFEPGSNWSYSNSGFVLAGVIVEKITGQPFNDFVSERILKKLNMTETSFGSSDYALPGKTAEYAGNTPKGKIKMETQYDWYWAYGAGQLISTVDDMLKWDEALYDAGFIRPDLLKTAHIAIPLTTGLSANYGLGWAVDTLNGKAVIQHGGSIGGYRAQGMRLPDDHIYMILLSNSGTTNSSLTLNKALSLLYNVPPVREQRQEIQSWKEMEGVYESLNSGSRLQKNMGDLPAFFTIRTDSLNRVTVQRSSSAAITLTPAGKDKLYDKSSPFTTWRFNRNEQGKVISFTIEQLLPTMGPERTNLKIADVVPAIKKPVMADSAQLTAYTGLFRHELGSSARIIQVKNNLYMEDPEFKTRTQLHWLNGNQFWIKELDREVNFIRDKKGNVTSIQYSNGSQIITLLKSNELY